MRVLSPDPLAGKLALVTRGGSESNVGTFNANRPGFGHLVASGDDVLNVSDSTCCRRGQAPLGAGPFLDLMG